MREFTRSSHAETAFPDARTRAKAFGDPDSPDPLEREAFMYSTMGEAGLLATGEPEYGYDDGPSLALPTEVITPEELLQTLMELPEPALDAANTLVAYADGVLFLVLNLRVLFLEEIFVDWDAVLRNSELVGQHTWIVSHDKAKKDETPDTSAAATRQAVRSTFRIMAGVCIGLLLWLIVRKL